MSNSSYTSAAASSGTPSLNHLDDVFLHAHNERTLVKSATLPRPYAKPSLNGTYSSTLPSWDISPTSPSTVRNIDKYGTLPKSFKSGSGVGSSSSKWQNRKHSDTDISSYVDKYSIELKPDATTYKGAATVTSPLEVSKHTPKRGSKTSRDYSTFSQNSSERNSRKGIKNGARSGVTVVNAESESVL